MPARLREEDDLLLLKLGGDSDEFQRQKAAAKTIAGYRWEPAKKVWVFRNDDETLIQLARRVEPDMTKPLEQRLQAAAAEQADQLVTILPDDASVAIPWRERLAPKQRSAVDFMAEHPHCILADDMGAGKTAEAISTIYEALIRASILLNGNTNQDLSELSPDAPGARVLAEFRQLGRTPGLLQGMPEGDAAQTNSEGDGGPEEVQGSAVCRLRDSAASGVHGSGSHQTSAVRSDESGVESENDGGRVGPMRASVPELSSAATLPRPRVLVICLNAATGHWQREIKKWCGDESTVIDGDKEHRLGELEKSENWTIINWEKLPLMVKHLAKIKWDAVFADEAHFAKNPKAKRTKALWKCRAPIQLAISGTPIMNNPGELFPLLKWCRPDQYTSYWAFFYKFTEYHEGARHRKIVTGVKNPDALRFELADKLVRRSKREIHPDIPEPFDPIVYEPPMKPEQEKLYKAAVKDFWLEVAQEIKPEDREDLAEAVERDDFETVKLMIPNAAARMVRQRQIATSPALLGGPDESSKLDEIERLVVDGGSGRPWVWFAWYRETVDLLVKRFNALGIEAHGFKGDEGNRPDELAQSFQAGEFDIIVGTIKSGGQSIEFFRASDCGFAEEEFVPGINQQAFDRVDRKGQQQRPQRHIIRVPGTVETGRVAPAQATKNIIVKTILGGSA